MKSIWLENAAQPDKYWVQMFEDYGIPNNHQFICKANDMPKQQLADLFILADQICFFSSMTSSGIEMVEHAIKAFDHFEIKDKKIISGGYLLERLNGNMRFYINLFTYRSVFDDNKICELDDGVIKRMQFSMSKQMMVYTETLFKHKNDIQ